MLVLAVRTLTRYAAPEILRQHTYSSAVDLWSLGVVVFVLLSGYEPFHGETLLLRVARAYHTPHLLTCRMPPANVYA